MIHRRFPHQIFSALVLALGIVAALWAQMEGGTIAGTVTGPAGSAVLNANAQVSVVNTATGFQRTVLTAANGEYVAYSIPTGPYVVNVISPGFQS